MESLHSHHTVRYYGRQTIAYKVMKTLDSSEKEKVIVNMTEEREWTSNYRKLYFDSAIERTLMILSENGLEKLTVELKQALNGMRSR